MYIVKEIYIILTITNINGYAKIGATLKHWAHLHI